MNFPPHKTEGYDWTRFRPMIPAYPATVEFEDWLDGETVLDAYTEVDGVIWNLEIICDGQLIVRRCHGGDGGRLIWERRESRSKTLAIAYFACLLMERAL